MTTQDNQTDFLFPIVGEVDKQELRHSLNPGGFFHLLQILGHLGSKFPQYAVLKDVGFMTQSVPNLRLPRRGSLDVLEGYRYVQAQLLSMVVPGRVVVLTLTQEDTPEAVSMLVYRLGYKPMSKKDPSLTLVVLQPDEQAPDTARRHCRAVESVVSLYSYRNIIELTKAVKSMFFDLTESKPDGRRVRAIGSAIQTTIEDYIAQTPSFSFQSEPAPHNRYLERLDHYPSRGDRYFSCDTYRTGSRRDRDIHVDPYAPIDAVQVEVVAFKQMENEAKWILRAWNSGECRLTKHELNTIDYGLEQARTFFSSLSVRYSSDDLPQMVLVHRESYVRMVEMVELFATLERFGNDANWDLDNMGWLGSTHPACVLARKREQEAAVRNSVPDMDTPAPDERFQLPG